MLWIGAGITLAFVLIALLAPVIAPYEFDAFRADGKRFPQLEAPSSELVKLNEAVALQH